jgi:hypothetical protein
MSFAAGMGLVALIVASSGCAAMRAGAARQKYINDQTQQHVYKMPITQVWPNVRTLLFEQGYQSKTSDTGGSYSLETEPKMDEKVAVRYLVQGVKIDDSSCRIEFMRMSAGEKGTKSDRDLEMEWRLLQKVDTASADQIKKQAEGEADKAKAAS